MSRYSPTVLETPGYSLGQALLEGVDSFRAERRQKKADQQRDEDRELDRRTKEIGHAKEGFRPGTAPVDAPDPADMGDALAVDEVPSSIRQGRMTPRNLQPAPTFDPRALAQEFESPELEQLPAAMTTNRPELFKGPMMAPPAPAPAAATHPGAFNPGTRSFGPPAAAAAPPAPSRYTPVDGGYIDEEATPRAESARDRAFQLQLAGEMRRGDIQERGQQQTSLEDQKQAGRVTLRNSINDNRLVNTALAALLRMQGQEQHDTRAGAQSREHDNRVGARGGSGGGAGAANARERNAMTLGERIIEASNGSYDNAVDWLENTDEGRAAAANGLSRQHLYAGLGSFMKNQQRLATGMQSGGAMDASEATAATTSTRQGITPPRRSAPGEPTGMAGIRTGAGA
jgi:hypothetical protein